jgi:hypothetical protein
MDVFTALSVAAVVVGGLLMAFSARWPTRLASWASAYLVLVAGAVQLGLVAGWGALGGPHTALALAAFSLYNLGNICVLLGTILKPRSQHHPAVVNSGGGLLALAMALLVWAVGGTGISWTLAGLLVLVVVILIGMPTGLVMSARRKNN